MKKKWIVIATIVVIVVISGILVEPIISDVETPNYRVIELHGNFEIRRYEPIIIADVQIEGNRKKAIRNGFHLLADYIFGNNTVKQEIAMTALVQQQESNKIRMTAPVQQQFTDGIWQVSDVMSSEYSMDTAFYAAQ